MIIWHKILFAISMSLVGAGMGHGAGGFLRVGWSMHPMGWMGGFWGIGMVFMMLLFWILIIASSLISHCQGLVRIYEQAAAENMATAKSHQEMAAEAK